MVNSSRARVPRTSLLLIISAVESGGFTHALINSHITYLICAARNSIRTLSQQMPERIIDSICVSESKSRSSRAGLIHWRALLLIGEQILLNLILRQVEEILEVIK